MALLVIADVIVLARLMPQWSALRRSLAAPHQWIAEAGADRAAIVLAGALLWIAALWLAVGLAAAIAALIPGRMGALSASIAVLTLPTGLRRLVISAAGASLLLAPANAFAAGVSAASPSVSSAARPVVGVTAATDAALPAVAWPVGSTGVVDSGTQQAPAPVSSPSAASASSSTTPRTTTALPAVRPPVTDARATRDGAEAAQPTSVGGGAGRSEDGSGTVTVAAGDSLWAIAAHRLGPAASDAQIAQAWPQWYDANRERIGADPNLIHPGTRLAVPEIASKPAGAEPNAEAGEHPAATTSNSQE